MKIHRANVVEELLKIYSQKGVHTEIQVSYINEKGVDLDGLMKDLFFSFWDAVKYQYFTGEKEFVPRVGPDVRDDLFVIFGRILGDGYLACGYLPLYLARPIYLLICGVDVADSDILSSFLNLVSPSERNTLLEALKCENIFTTQVSVYEKVLSIFSRYGNRELPCASKLNDQVIQIAKCEIVLKTAYARTKIMEGLCESPFYLNGNFLFNAVCQMQPTVSKVLKFLVIEEGLDEKADNVVDFFKLFIESSDGTTLAKLLRFISSTDALLGPIQVSFNSLIGNQRRITANTCSNTVHLPKSYGSYCEFANDLKAILNNPSTWVFDSL